MKRVYTEEQKEKRRANKRKWYQKNKEKVSVYNKNYSKVYRDEHREELLEKKREYYETHSEDKRKYMEEYGNTQIGRAANLVSAYKQMDARTKVGETTVTKEWVVDNIFTKSCVYCGDDDWHNLGCDRLDNSKPHTPENCVPCCGKCNVKKGKTKTYEEYLKMLAEQPC